MPSQKKVRALPTLCVTPSQPCAYLVQPRASVVRCARETSSHGGDEAAGGSNHPMASPPLVLHCSAPTWRGRGSGPFVVSLVRCSDPLGAAVFRAAACDAASHNSMRKPPWLPQSLHTIPARVRGRAPLRTALANSA
ncbi:hypothetical protein, unlikely [Trypanosoma congolense IL3000]|uniref:Uncharacterized protein n=1 Tax=Trypanosoma congolense (strain IL3000) TaxID=1068625 RepID=F9WE49_TRYCI|nr:hypothetical protein, unlikely [Trypanosoma congolense IL3000]